MAGDGDITTTPGPPADPHPALEPMLEALLVATDTPISAAAVAAVVDAAPEAVEAALTGLAQGYVAAARGMRLRETASGWQLYAAPEHLPMVERIVLDAQPARLSQAALETLAIVAYQQPVPRGKVAAVRGVNVDAVMRTLLSRGLVVEVGQDPQTGAVLFGTTDAFLDKIGLLSLDQLPALAPLVAQNEALDRLVDELSTSG